MTLKAVIFDYGHTIVNFEGSEEDLLTCYEQVRVLLVAQAYDELPQAPELVEALSKRVDALVRESYDRRELEELDVLELYQSVFKALGVSLPVDLVHRVVEMEHRALTLHLEVPRENLQVLQALRQRGLKIGLVSNAYYLPQLMRDDIERLGIAPYVDDAVFSSELGLRKPHPAIFLKVLDELDVRPQDALFVGDRLHDDIEGAQSLGMKGVLTHQFRREEPGEGTAAPALIVEQLSDVLPYVDRFLAT